jgi:hypothetical protein
MPIETFAFVFTVGKTRGCEKDPTIVFAVGVAVVVVSGECAFPKRTLTAAIAAASISAMKTLVNILVPWKSE